LGIEQAAVVPPVPGMNIHILEETDNLGGSLDAQGSPYEGYILRGGRLFDEEAYICTYDLLSSQAGTITVESKGAQGAGFVVTLPKAS
jgi:myosin-crossreactive antigen